MLEVAVPALQGRIERRNHASRWNSPRYAWSWRGFCPVRPSDFSCAPNAARLQTGTPETRTLDPSTRQSPIWVLSGWSVKSVRTHPSTHAGQRRFRFLPTATQHHGVIRVAHHHQPGFTHFDVKLMKVNVREQGANHRPLRTARGRRPSLHVFHDVLLEKPLNELQHATIRNPSSHFREKGCVWNRVKVALQVRVHHPEVARFQMPVHFAQRILAAQTLPKAVASAARIRAQRSARSPASAQLEPRGL